MKASEAGSCLDSMFFSVVWYSCPQKVEVDGAASLRKSIDPLLGSNSKGPLWAKYK